MEERRADEDETENVEVEGQEKMGTWRMGGRSGREERSLGRVPKQCSAVSTWLFWTLSSANPGQTRTHASNSILSYNCQVNKPVDYCIRRDVKVV